MMAVIMPEISALALPIFALSLALPRAGNSRPASIPMIAMFRTAFLFFSIMLPNINTTPIKADNNNAFIS